MAAIAAIVLFILLSCTAVGQPILSEIFRSPVPDGASRILRTFEKDLVFLLGSTDRVAVRPESEQTTIVSGGFGWGPDALDGPTGISSDGLSIFVSDKNNHRIIRCDRRLRPLSALRTRDTSFAPARFGYPLGVDINGKGDLAILDGENKDVVVFDAFGRFKFRVGNDARSGRVFHELSDITHDQQDNWYLADNGHIWKVDAFGNLIGGAPIPWVSTFSVSAGQGFLAVAGMDSVMLLTPDLQPLLTLPARQVRLDGPTPEVFDIHAVERTVFILFSDCVVQYALE